MTSAKRILVAPLDWGMGHATRCIPVIREIRARGGEVIVAGSGPHIDLLTREFPDCQTVPMLNYAITYAPSPLLLALKFPAMLGRVVTCARAEHRRLHTIVAEHRIDAAVSDQRFGCWSRDVPSVYITHQLCLKMPRGFRWLEPVFAAGLRSAARRYREVWIPDVSAGDGLTGDLTRRYPLSTPHRYVGPLSRFAGPAPDPAPEDRPDLLIMLSGPEPQRSILERRILNQAPSFGGSVVMLPGRPAGDRDSGLPPRIRIITDASTARVHALILGARAIVCRGGYTTIMELTSLGRTAALIPTPGQSEQEYLCRHLSASGRFLAREQSSFDLREAAGALAGLPTPPPLARDQQALGDAVERLVTGVRR